MRKFIKLMCLAGLAFTLTACVDQNSYEYLVTHPVALKKKMDACESGAATASDLEKQQCEVAASASKKFMQVVTEQQIDPEKFGTRVMTAEAEYVDAKAKVKQLTADLAKSNAANDSAASNKLESELAAAQKDCEDKRLEVKILLAVVGLSAPN